MASRAGSIIKTAYRSQAIATAANHGQIATPVQWLQVYLRRCIKSMPTTNTRRKAGTEYESTSTRRVALIENMARQNAKQDTKYHRQWRILVHLAARAKETLSATGPIILTALVYTWLSWTGATA